MKKIKQCAAIAAAAFMAVSSIPAYNAYASVTEPVQEGIAAQSVVDSQYVSLTTTAVSTDSLTFSWDDSEGTENYNYYVVYYPMNEKEPSVKTVTVEKTNTVTLNDLKSDTQYFIYVYRQDPEKHTSALLTMDQVKTAAVTSDSLTFSWGDSKGTENYNYFIVYYPMNEKEPSVKTVTIEKTNTVTLSGLKSDTQYFIYVYRQSPENHTSDLLSMQKIKTLA